MEQDWSVPGWAVVASLAMLLVLVLATLVALRWVLRRGRAHTEAALAVALAESEQLRAQLAAIERRLAAPRAAEQEYKITLLGDDRSESESEHDRATEDGHEDRDAALVSAPLFADLVLRESVVQAVSLAAGLRRALAPETRHRIRFEMRREVKRARKQRRVDARLARAEFEERRRRRPEPSAEGSAA